MENVSPQKEQRTEHQAQIITETTYRKRSNLVPILAKKDFEGVAQDFLSQYYPEALAEPIAINVDEVVSRMGLTIQEAKMSLDSTLYAAITFRDCEIDIWCSDTMQHIPASFKADTILYDPTVFPNRNTGRFRSTIIHECVHWFLHRHHYLQKQYDPNADFLKCITGKRPVGAWSDQDWMEWQANGITPRILMPYDHVRRVIDYAIWWNEPHFERYRAENVKQVIIGTVANHFGTSFKMAQIRMLDLGYVGYEGILPYVNDAYTDCYNFSTSSKEDLQTFTLSKDEVIHQYRTNEHFREVMDSGRFLYVDGFVVLASPKYVMTNIYNEPVLTPYARQNIGECCLRFDLVINTRARQHGHSPSATPSREHLFAMFKDANVDLRRVPFFRKDKHNMELFNRTEELKRYYYEIASEITFAFETEQTFSQYAWRVIRKKGLNRQVFQDRTLLSSTMYDRIKNNEFEANPKIETVMALCIGLSLSGSQAEKMLEMAGHKLNDSPLHVVYRSFLYTLRGRTIYDYNEILAGFNMPLLGKKVYTTISSS